MNVGKETQTTETIEVLFENTKEQVINYKNYALGFTNMKLRVCAYARVSTDFEEQKTSYNSQIIHYENFIKNNPNWTFVKVYADEGISGTQLKNREEFNKMIQDALNGLIDMIIVKSISRFARNTVDVLNIVRMLRENNVDVFFEKENIHTLSISNELFLTIYSAFAQGESESTSENMKGGLQMKMRRGEMVGQKAPYGFRYDKEIKQIIVYEEEAKIVRRIFEEYATGKGTTTIANGLNNDGILSVTKRKWADQTIRKIILNEKYVGDLRTGKTFVESVVTHKKRINRGESKQYYTSNHHEAIISRELWNECQSIYNIRSAKTDGIKDQYKRRYAFSSKIYCGYCGERFVRKSYLKKKDDPTTRVIYWGCRSHGKKIPCESNVKIYDDYLKSMFVEMFNKLFNDFEKYEQVFLKKVEQCIKTADNGEELKKLQKEELKLKEKQKKLIDLMLDDEISKDVLNEKNKDITSKLEIITEKINKFGVEKSSIEKNKNQLEKIKNIIKDEKELSEFDDEVFNSLVDKIIIGDKISNEEYDYNIVKFVLKTGNVVSNSFNYDNILNDGSVTANYGQVNVILNKESFSSGLTAYVESKRFWVCNEWRKHYK